MLIKIPDTSGLMTAPVLNTRTSGLVKKQQIMTQKLLKLRRTLLIMNMLKILLKNLIS